MISCKKNSVIFGIAVALFTIAVQNATLAESQSVSSTTPVKFIWPAEGFLVSGYGWRWGRMHYGIQIANSPGTPIYAASEGVVEKAGWNNDRYGNLVEIRHTDSSLTRYGRVSKVLVQVGQQVRQGEEIALMGSTGYHTGSALSFEIYMPVKTSSGQVEGTTRVDPIKFLPKRDRQQ